MKAIVHCEYCFNEFESNLREIFVGYGQGTTGYRNGYAKVGNLGCSPECSKRLSVWTRWIDVTRQQAILGDVNKVARVSPLGSSGLADAVAKFQVDDRQGCLL